MIPGLAVGAAEADGGGHGAAGARHADLLAQGGRRIVQDAHDEMTRYGVETPPLERQLVCVSGKDLDDTLHPVPTNEAPADFEHAGVRLEGGHAHVIERSHERPGQERGSGAHVQDAHPVGHAEVRAEQGEELVPIGVPGYQFHFLAIPASHGSLALVRVAGRHARLSHTPGDGRRCNERYVFIAVCRSDEAWAEPGERDEAIRLEEGHARRRFEM